MFKTFFRHYFELPEKAQSIVCLGGGVGTAQILKGLRHMPYNLTAIVSMADDGGSAGRLRRAFSVPPPGDLVNCLAALSDEESVIKELFLYRFAGQRYGKDTDLGGQKLGNLIFVALVDIYKGDTGKALEEFSRIISPRGRVLPATLGDVNIWAKTADGKKVYGEQNIDLGKYKNRAKSLKEVHLDPPKVKTYKAAADAIKTADIIIVGPGDLFSTILPVIIVPQIKNLLLSSKAKKIFIVNIANKPFETAGFKVSDHINTLEAHLGTNPFDKILVNSNQDAKIPQGFNYKYVNVDTKNLDKLSGKIIEGNYVDESFAIYHNSQKMAAVIENLAR
ncbi:MAG: YvcK family protein [Candidatus Curtissbacteria bacterium]|nr:YvcK family protein [Candidatus Curtissbacteria bacterium]